jgi:hypothetical protein
MERALFSCAPSLAGARFFSLFPGYYWTYLGLTLGDWIFQKRHRIDRQISSGVRCVEYLGGDA